MNIVAELVFYNDDYGNVSLPAGNSTLEFVAVNKNPSSGGYTMSFDYFELITLERTDIRLRRSSDCTMASDYFELITLENN